jgi:pimeloyl-ACP methyl ester carboxylesterase
VSVPATGSARSDGTKLRGHLAAVLIPVMLLVGCASSVRDRMDRDEQFVNPDRMNKGFVIILPGIEGESTANRDVRKGLDEAGTPYALAIYRWGFPVPGIGMLMNQTDTAGNRRAAVELAKGIVRYQTRHPGCPVFLVGHSAGGGEAVFTLEALADLPGARPVRGAILLSSSISADYSLDKALKMTQCGIVNGYNPQDTALLGTGTAIMGNVDGGHGDSAGRTGFYGTYPKLFQFKASAAGGGGGDPHFILTEADRIAKHAPRWILSETWPPPGSSAAARGGPTTATRPSGVVTSSAR